MPVNTPRNPYPNSSLTPAIQISLDRYHFELGQLGVLVRNIEGLFLQNEPSEDELMAKYKETFGKLQELIGAFLPLIDQNSEFGKFLLARIEKKFRNRNPKGNLHAFLGITTNLRRILEGEIDTLMPAKQVLDIKRIYDTVMVSVQSLGIANYENVLDNSHPETALGLQTNITEFRADRAHKRAQSRISKILDTPSV